MMETAWASAIFAIFTWWFFTGAILLIVRRSDAGDATGHGKSVVLTVPLLALGYAGLIVSSTILTVSMIYVAFASALLVWGWIELAFLAGIVTGPERCPCPAGLTGWTRFFRAFKTVAYHELLLLGTVSIIGAITAAGVNQFGFWAFIVLFTARISAKLNLFYGVPRINTEFVPVPLQHLKSYFRQGSVTAAFPIGVTFLSVLTAYFGHILLNASTAPTTVGYALLTALTALAALEHWLMVIPLPDAKLWRWMLPVPPTTGNSNEL
jgi:putative photosynthetic complex assembly protein 2